MAKAKKSKQDLPVEAATGLDTPIETINGVGPKLVAAFAKRRVRTVGDALYLLPNRYEDRTRVMMIAELATGQKAVFKGTVVSANTAQTSSGRRIFEAVVKDDTGTLRLKWFHFSKYVTDPWKVGRQAVIAGEVQEFNCNLEILHPDAEWLEPGQDICDLPSMGSILPVYPLSQGIHQKSMFKIMHQVVEQYSDLAGDPIPRDIAKRQQLLPLSYAIRQVHFPATDMDMTALCDGAGAEFATLAFDDFFFLQLGFALKSKSAFKEQGISFQPTWEHIRPLMAALQFDLTGAQKRVMREIRADMESQHPMHRLVQGDVGSGKTIVAFLAALMAIENGYQVALVAPTEILAEQHYFGLREQCEHLGIKICLLTSAANGKAATLREIADGTVQLVVGTHAVIQEKVEFARLGLGIIDEQHRFGVMQRGELKRKGNNPDMLVMTATPIPRTLAMSVYGDLSVSVIDELPPGRTPILTKVCTTQQRKHVYELVRREVGKGRQAYVVYPLVEETEKSDLMAATQMAELLQREVFPGLRVACLHGRMSADEKDGIMKAFKDRKTDILVATTVIEVGINVPNATVMVIEHAERFGLAQLHQLRGRVGRGADKSFCALTYEGSLTDDGQKRLRIMEETNDGFRIAEADLEIRGAGDFLGTRQSGLPDFRVANVLRDSQLLEEARKEAFALIDRDPDLQLPEHQHLVNELARRWGSRLEIATIG